MRQIAFVRGRGVSLAALPFASPPPGLPPSTLGVDPKTSALQIGVKNRADADQSSICEQASYTLTAKLTAKPKSTAKAAKNTAKSKPRKAPTTSLRHSIVPHSFTLLGISRVRWFFRFEISIIKHFVTGLSFHTTPEDYVVVSPAYHVTPCLD